MTNAFYNKTFNALPDTLIRSASANAEFTAIANGFDSAEAEIAASVRAPTGETLTKLPALALRANKSLVFDAAGNPQVTVAASSAEMAAAVAAASAASASASAAAISAGTVAGMANAIYLLQLQAGIL